MRVRIKYCVRNIVRVRIKFKVCVTVSVRIMVRNRVWMRVRVRGILRPSSGQDECDGKVQGQALSQ